MVHSSWDRLAPSWLRSVGSAVDTTTTSRAAMNAPAEASPSVQPRRIEPGWPAGPVRPGGLAGSVHGVSVHSVSDMSGCLRWRVGLLGELAQAARGEQVGVPVLARI